MEDRSKEIVKHTVKDSVFTHLFRDKKYLKQLYQTLHPEDRKVTEEEIVDVTMENVLTDGIYNDLGFRVGERLMVLVEAQSTWTMNIVIRIFIYLAQTYHNYFESNRENLYGSKKVKMPKPEAYVIFTGKRKSKPEYISLSKEFFGEKECAVEVKVKMLYGSGGTDIISQYINFTKVYDGQRKKFGKTRKAIEETIRICKNENVLKEYLENKEKEVVDIMMTLFDEERIIQNYVEDEKRKAAKEAAGKMLRDGKLSAEEIAGYFTELSMEDIREIENMLMK